MTTADGRRFLNVQEVAAMLRTTTSGVYAMVARRQLPGVVRLNRRILVDQRVLLDRLDRNRAASPKE